jgi:hypothetical protein
MFQYLYYFLSSKYAIMKYINITLKKGSIKTLLKEKSIMAYKLNCLQNRESRN